MIARLIFRARMACLNACLRTDPVLLAIKTDIREARRRHASVRPHLEALRRRKLEMLGGGS